MMRRIDRPKALLTIGGLAIALLVCSWGHAQCSNFDNQYPAGVQSTNSANWTTVANNINGGEYAAYNVISGDTYEWSNCGGNGFNSQLTVWNTAHDTWYAYDTDFCGNRAQVSWVATFTGQVHVLLSRDDCRSNNKNARIRWRVEEAVVPAVNDEACDAIIVAVGGSCTFSTYDNEGATLSPSPASCGNNTGGDVWFAATVGASGRLVIETQAGEITDGAMAVYTGSCNGLTEIACDDDSGPGYMPELLLTGLTPGETVYIRFYSYNGSEVGEFDLCVYDDCTSLPSNDQPCQAPYLYNGVDQLGSNACATSIAEPGMPTCWSPGPSSSVWYRFVASASGSARITVFPGQGLTDTRVALYGGPCNDLTEVACALYEPTECRANSPTISQLEYEELTPYAIYYVRVDGEDGTQGEFDIRLSSWLLADVNTAQDCSGGIVVCGDKINVADPGVQGIGADCNFSGTGNCTGGEKNSIWYRVAISADGDFKMTLRPNHADDANCGPETDYDFLVWKVAGSGTLADCASLQTNSGLGLLACNYSPLGITGIADGGDAPAGINGCFDEAFESPLALNAGDELLIVVQNFSGSTRGFEVDMSMSDPGMVGFHVPETVYWDGSTNNRWNSSGNWGDCDYVPSCTINAVVNPAGADHPVMTGNHYVNDLTIAPGATLQMDYGSRLFICGSFSNFGSVDISGGAFITFLGDGPPQVIRGEFTGANSSGTIFVEKDGGTVELQTDLDITGSFSTRNPTSVFSQNGFTMRLGGSFTNSDGANTFTDVGASGRIVFNGTAQQNYNQGSSDLRLNEVQIDKSGGFVKLVGDMYLQPTTGRLELTNGVIRTSGYKVIVENGSPDAVTEGHVDSYVQGKLRRYVQDVGVYDFPLGNAAKGYQRAQIDFLANDVDYLTGEFKNWPSTPGPLLQNDCFTFFDHDALDNGFFQIDASNDPASALYDITLYNRSYTNEGVASGWTVMKDSGSGYFLDGDCVDSTPGAVGRTGLTGFSTFATAQSTSPLPVEWLSFTGTSEDEGNLLNWITASEKENDHFEVLRSEDGSDFEKIGQVEGNGNSSVENSYWFLDEDPPTGLAYYRLNQVDHDGENEASETIQVHRLGEAGIAHLNLYPVPTTDLINIEFVHLYTERIRYVIYSARGRQVLEESEVSDSGVNRKQFRIKDLQSGLYHLEIRDGRDRLLVERSFVKMD